MSRPSRKRTDSTPRPKERSSARPSNESPRSRGNSGTNESHHPLYRLQRDLGNQATRHAIKKRVQPKLEVGRPNDKYEREADRIAKAVTTNSDQNQVSPPAESTGQAYVQQMCTRCQARLQQGKPLNCADCEQTLQRKETGSTDRTVESEVAQQIQSSRGRGRRLPDTVRATFEPQFGQDFGDVQIHDGRRAAELNRTLNARAFTHGRDIYFGTGNYDSESVAGKRLLAHELTHVVQQDRAVSGRVQRQSASGATAQPQTPYDEEVGTKGSRRSTLSLFAEDSSFQLELDTELQRLLSTARTLGDPPRIETTLPSPFDLNAALPSQTPSPFDEPLKSPGPDTDLIKETAGGSSVTPISPDLTRFLGLENLQQVFYGGINPNRIGTAVRSTSETRLGRGFSLRSERELSIPERSIFGTRTNGLRFENYSGLRFSLGELELELGQTTVTATGELSTVETQQIGRIRIELGPAEVIYRNDHDFFELVGLNIPPLPILGEMLGGGTDKGLTAALDLNLDLVELGADPHLFHNVFLEQIGISLELNTGEPLQYGTSATALPTYDPSHIRHPEVDRGELTLTSLLRHRPSEVAVSLGAGVNSSVIRDAVQGTVHDLIDVPRFPVTPYLEFTLNVGVSVPFDL